MVATFGNVDTFVLSLQNCRFIDDYVGANSLSFVSFILQVVDSNIGGDIFILILTYKPGSLPFIFLPNLDFDFGVDIDIGEPVVEIERGSNALVNWIGYQSSGFSENC